MKPLFLPLLLLILLSIRTAGNAAEPNDNPDEAKPQLAPEVNRFDTTLGLPDIFHLGYIIESDSVSPDGNYGVIVPTQPSLSGQNCKNYFAALHPLRILRLCAEEYYPFERRHGGELNVLWTPDNSVALVIVAGRWGTVSAILFEVRSGRLTRSTDLLAEVEKIALPDFRRSKVEPHNEDAPFVATEGGEISEGGALEKIWRLEHDGRVQINCLFGSDPEENGVRAWNGRVRAVWDIAQHKFTQQKCTRISK